MSSENTISTIKKLIDTLVIPNIKPVMEYDVIYNEISNKNPFIDRILVDVTLYIDVKKMIPNSETYDPDYMNDAYELENTLEDTLEYLGLPFDRLGVRIYIEYLNDEFLNLETKELQGIIIRRLMDDFEISENIASTLFVTISKQEEGSPSLKLEVVIPDTTELHEKGITYSKLEDIIYHEIENNKTELPLIYELHLDDVDFWFG